MSDDSDPPRSGEAASQQTGDDDTSLTGTEIAMVRSGVLDEVSRLLTRLEGEAYDRYNRPNNSEMDRAKAHAYADARRKIWSELGEPHEPRQ